MNTSLRYALILILVTSAAAAGAKTGVNLAPVAKPSTSHVSRDTSLAARHWPDADVARSEELRRDRSHGQSSTGEGGG